MIIFKRVKHSVFGGVLNFSARGSALRIVMFMAFAFLSINLMAPKAAYSETRTLKLYYLHTGEKASITFKKNGRYIKSGLKKLNRFLRDWRRNEPTNMDPKLFDLIWEVYKETRSRKYIHVISGFRSMKTNNMLRKKGRGVARRSQHTQGRALDFFIPGVSLSKLRAIGLRKGIGGVGYYPRSGSPFVHMDTGRIRHWPRMTRRQLKKVFPKGRTVHVPTDGKPLPGYKQALADAKRRKSGKAVYTASKSSGNKKGFLANLFNPGGGSDEDEDNSSNATAPRQVQSVKVPAPKKRDNAIDNVIKADGNNPVQPALERVPLPKLAPRNNVTPSIEQAPEVPNPDSAIGALIAAIPTPRPNNPIDQSIAADELVPVETVQNGENMVGENTAEVASNIGVDDAQGLPDNSVATALAPSSEKPVSAITSRIENALFATEHAGDTLKDGAPELPFKKKNINVDAEKAIIAALEPETPSKPEISAEGADKANDIDDVLAKNNNQSDEAKKLEDATLVAAITNENNPLLKDREELIKGNTSLDEGSIPLPKGRPDEDEIIFQTLVSQLEENKRTAFDEAISEEKASIPDLAIGDLESTHTTLLAFQKASIAEVALMRAPAYGQNMVKLAPSRVLKGGFHNDFDITPTNRFAAITSDIDLAKLD